MGVMGVLVDMVVTGVWDMAVIHHLAHLVAVMDMAGQDIITVLIQKIGMLFSANFQIINRF